MSDDVFELTPGERSSALWQKILRHVNEKLDNARGKNDGPHDAIVTATLRGQIAVYKMLLGLDKDS